MSDEIEINDDDNRPEIQQLMDVIEPMWSRYVQDQDTEKIDDVSFIVRLVDLFFEVKPRPLYYDIFKVVEPNE